MQDHFAQNPQNFTTQKFQTHGNKQFLMEPIENSRRCHTYMYRLKSYNKSGADPENIELGRKWCRISRRRVRGVVGRVLAVIIKCFGRSVKWGHIPWHVVPPNPV